MSRKNIGLKVRVHFNDIFMKKYLKKATFM